MKFIRALLPQIYIFNFCKVSKLQDHCKKLNERIIQEKGRTLRIESQLRTEGLENSENKKKITSLLQRIDMEKQSTQLTLSEMFQLQEENAELKTDLSQTYNEVKNNLLFLNSIVQ